MSRKFSTVVAALLFVCLAASFSFAASGETAKYEEVVGRGVDFLLSQQGADGAWSKQAGPAVTALCTCALLDCGRGPSDPAVAKALAFLEGFVQEDGSIHHPKSTFHNYETSISVLAFQKANRDGKYDKIIKNAEKFIRGGQFDEADGKKESDVEYGGFGYGGDRRPDLSNTQVALDALKSLGAGDDDPAVQKALTFVSRCQNLESGHNTTEFAAKINDGGFYYAPFNETGAAGTTDDGGLRSYGTMTYAGLKSMIYAGVGADDPRVKAANEWIAKNYALDSNPGMGDNGLYYYYHTFAKALGVMDQDEIKDAEGKSHHWKAELVAELAQRQADNGGWVNKNTRWLEGDQNLVTAYCLLALAYCHE